MKEEHIESAAVERQSIKDTVASNLDVIAAIVGGLILVLHLLGVVLGPPADLEQTVDKLTAGNSATLDHFENTRFDFAGHTAKIDAAKVEVEGGWSKLPDQKVAAPQWITYPEVLVAQVKAGESNEIEFRAPEDVGGEAKFGANVVTWNVHQDNNVPISGFKIMRKTGGGKLVELDRVGTDVFEYEDKAVKAGIEYRYRVIALTDEPTVVDQVPESPVSEPISVMAIADFKIELVSTDRGKNTAVFDVEKYHDESWPKKRFTVKVGAVIGEKDIGSGVDFATGRILKNLQQSKVTETKPREEVVFDEAGKVVVKDGSPVTTSVQIEETAVIVTVRLEEGGLPPRTLTDPNREILSSKEKR
ncbi:MAG: hypothetical protein CL908_11880 [Deltaproteobacteria bacterium]|nr:hypothetical protein [Deltaproteobacteria bacterium]